MLGCFAASPSTLALWGGELAGRGKGRARTAVSQTFETANATDVPPCETPRLAECADRVALEVGAGLSEPRPEIPRQPAGSRWRLLSRKDRWCFLQANGDRSQARCGCFPAGS